jgi:hypothetical protein
MRVVCLTLFLLLATVALAPTPQQPTIRADVNLVQLQVTVTEAGGHTVSGLGKNAFQLFVDDTPQEITMPNRSATNTRSVFLAPKMGSFITSGLQPLIRDMVP